MTDKEKLDRLVAEIERRYKEQNTLHTSYSCGRNDEDAELLSFYDSLQEEPQVKESEKTQHDNETCKENGDSLAQEPVSEDFKEFEVEYFEREKDNIVCVYDRHAGLVDGAKWQKERMNKQVLDATVHPSDGEIWVDCIFDLAPFKEDEKVKVIIIKQE